MNLHVLATATSPCGSYSIQIDVNIATLIIAKEMNFLFFVSSMLFSYPLMKQTMHCYCSGIAMLC